MRRIKKSDKRRPNTTPVPPEAVVENSAKENNASSDIVTAKLTESQDKFAKSLTDENDSLRNKNTTLRLAFQLSFSFQISS